MRTRNRSEFNIYCFSDRKYFYSWVGKFQRGFSKKVINYRFEDGGYPVRKERKERGQPIPRNKAIYKNRHRFKPSGAITKRQLKRNKLKYMGV